MQGLYKLYLGFVLLLGVLLASMLVGFRDFQGMTDAYSWRSHTYLVLVEVHELSESLSYIDSLGSLHAFTNDKRYLAPLRAEQAAFDRHWQRCDALAADNITQQQRLAQLQQIYRQWQSDYLKPLLAAQYNLSSDEEQQIEVRLAGLGQSLKARMQDFLTALGHEELRLLEKRNQRTIDSQMRTQRIFVGANLLSILLVCGLLVLLTHNTKQLARANTELGHEIAERRQAMQAAQQAEEAARQAREEAEQAKDEAERAKDEAERANRAKSEFLSRMSHELRTPLNAILGFGQLLDMDEMEGPRKEAVGHILKGGQHLLSLINEILDIARIEAGHLQISPEPVLVSEVFREVCDLLRPLATQRHIQFHNETVNGAVDKTGNSPGTVYVLADRQRLRQVLLNFVSNAIKYNRTEGAVTLSCMSDGRGMARLAVQDTGPGLTPEKQQRLFQPFDRLGAEQSEVEGTGLGLALSKGLIQAMKGNIGADSLVGQGSTFWVELRQVQGPLAQLEDKERDGRKGSGSNPSPQQATRKTATVLYIEDNLANLELIKRLLSERPGIRLLEAMQGGLGLELAEQHVPDLILLDLHLPDMSGHELLLRLQAEERLREIPVVILSADATPGQLRRLLDSGARDYLTKPIDVAHFFTVLNGYLTKHD